MGASVTYKSLSKHLRTMIEDQDIEGLYAELRKLKYGVSVKRSVKRFYEKRWGDGSFDLFKAAS